MLATRGVHLLGDVSIWCFGISATPEHLRISDHICFAQVVSRRFTARRGCDPNHFHMVKSKKCSYGLFNEPLWLLFAEVRFETSKRPDQEPLRSLKAVFLNQIIKRIQSSKDYWRLAKIFGRIPNSAQPKLGVQVSNFGRESNNAHQCCKGLLQSLHIICAEAVHHGSLRLPPWLPQFRVWWILDSKLQLHQVLQRGFGSQVSFGT